MNGFEKGFYEELEKIGEEITPTFAEEHPVLTTGLLASPWALEAAAQATGKKGRAVLRPLALMTGLGSLGGQVGIALKEHERLQELSPEEQQAAGWFARHPYLSMFLMPAATGSGITAYQTRKALEDAGKIKEKP